MIQILTADELLELTGRTPNAPPPRLKRRHRGFDEVVDALRAYEGLRHRWDPQEVDGLRAVIDACGQYVLLNMGVRRASRPHVLALKQSCVERLVEIEVGVRDERAAQARKNWERLRGGVKMNRFRDEGGAIVKTQVRLGNPLGANMKKETQSGMGAVSESVGAGSLARRMHRDSGSTLSFDLWVRLGAAFYAGEGNATAQSRETHEPGWMERLKGVAMFSAEERTSYEVRVEREVDADGAQALLMTADGDLFDTRAHRTHFSGDGWAIFVMSHEDRIYSMSHTLARFHHSSFLAGAPAQAAGEWKVEDGRLVAITRKSGHYKPSEAMFMRMLFFLKSRGIDLGSATAAANIVKDPADYDWRPAMEVLRGEGRPRPT